MRRKFVLVGVMLIVSLTAVFSAANALTYTGVIDITCAGVSNIVDLGTFDRDNTGIGGETVNTTITDGAGTVLLSEDVTQPIGDQEVFGGGTYPIAPRFNPITVTIKSLAGNGLPEQIVTVQQGNCAGLPTFGGTCLPLTADAVVGNMPFQTQADWAPGKTAPGVVINPGTYWVLGADSSGKYYKILLSCQYLWIPVESMQPSFQAPWSGQPLPTTNVED